MDNRSMCYHQGETFLLWLASNTFEMDITAGTKAGANSDSDQ